MKSRTTRIACLAASALVLGLAWWHAEPETTGSSAAPATTADAVLGPSRTPAADAVAQPKAEQIVDVAPSGDKGQAQQASSGLSEVESAAAAEVSESAELYQQAIHTFGGREQQERIMRAIHSQPQTHRFVMRAVADLDLALAVFGDNQAQVRAFFGNYLRHLGQQGQGAELAVVLRDMSLDLSRNGDRKGRRLDVEDAFLGWLQAVGVQQLLDAPEEILGRLSMTAEGWKIARLALSDQAEVIWDNESLHQRVTKTIAARTIK